MKRFFLRKPGSLSSSNRLDSSRSGSRKEKTYSIDCPHCSASQDVLYSGISTFCKKCHKVINLERVFNPPQLVDQGRPVLKQISCFHCKNKQSIPNKALSSFCKRCGKRINLQNYKITGKFNGSLETQGEVHITSSGELRSNIVCHNAIVEGKINGTLKALNKVELRQTAVFKGSIQSPNLVVKDGASIRAAFKITS